jgi:hypothetical protein
MIKNFKFFEGQINQLSIERIGLLNDYIDNGVNLMGYQPHRLTINGVTYQSTLSFRSYNEWVRLINIDEYWDYYMMGVLRPQLHYFNPEEEIVELHGHTQVHPLFVIDNPDEEYLYEYIMVPKNN